MKVSGSNVKPIVFRLLRLHSINSAPLDSGAHTYPLKSPI